MNTKPNSVEEVQELIANLIVNRFDVIKEKKQVIICFIKEGEESKQFKAFIWCHMYAERFEGFVDDTIIGKGITHYDAALNLYELLEMKIGKINTNQEEVKKLNKEINALRDKRNDLERENSQLRDELKLGYCTPNY